MSVAVVIAAWNAADSIAAAVRSALAEPEVSEVWVIDDASTDRTAATAVSADDGTGRLQVLIQPSNRGPAAARNLALARSQADWICVLDADDFFLPGRTARLLAAAASIEMVADALLRICPADPAPDPPFPSPHEGARRLSFAEFVQANISRKGEDRQELGFMKPLMSRRFLERHGLAYDERLRLGEDYDLYARALAAGARLSLLPPMGYVAVVRPDSISARHSIKDLAAFRTACRALAGARPFSAAERRVIRAQAGSVDKRLQWRRMIEAVKARDPKGILSTFTSPAVTGFLIARLLEQVRARLPGRGPVAAG